MNTLPVILRESAIDDLDAIFTFLQANGASDVVALAFVDRMKLRCRRIGDAPYGSFERRSLGAGLRSVPFERSGTIIYRVTDVAVEIVAVFYGGRDIPFER